MESISMEYWRILKNLGFLQIRALNSTRMNINKAIMVKCPAKEKQSNNHQGIKHRAIIGTETIESQTLYATKTKQAHIKASNTYLTSTN